MTYEGYLQQQVARLTEAAAVLLMTMDDPEATPGEVAEAKAALDAAVTNRGDAA